MNFNDTEGVYTYTFEAEKLVSDKLICSVVLHGAFQMVNKRKPNTASPPPRRKVWF